MALNRRFGARKTRAGNWKAFAATILGSEIIVLDDSEADRELDVSLPVLLMVTKNLTTSDSQSKGQGSAVPDLLFTSPISALSKNPSSFTSSRKFEFVTAWPD